MKRIYGGYRKKENYDTSKTLLVWVYGEVKKCVDIACPEGIDLNSVKLEIIEKDDTIGWKFQFREDATWDFHDMKEYEFEGRTYRPTDPDFIWSKYPKFHRTFVSGDHYLDVSIDMTTTKIEVTSIDSGIWLKRLAACKNGKYLT